MKFFLVIFCFVILVACDLKTSPTIDEAYKATTARLVHQLYNDDTNSILSLIAIEEYGEIKRREGLRDIKNLKAIVTRYGWPKPDEMLMEEGQLGEPVVFLPLVNEPDSVLNLESAFMRIYFFPSQFDSSSTKILNYELVVRPLVPLWDRHIIRDSLAIDFTNQEY